MPAEWETHTHCWMGWPVSTLHPNSIIILIVLLLSFVFLLQA